MSAAPSATYAGAGIPYFFPYGATLSTTTIIASTITGKVVQAEQLNVVPNAGTFFNVSTFNNSSTLQLNMVTDINYTNLINMSQLSGGNVTTSATLEIPDNTQDFAIRHYVGNVDANDIIFRSSLNGVAGGILIDTIGQVEINADEGVVINSELDMDNNAIVNVSSINGLVYPPTSPIFLYNNVASPLVKTVSGSGGITNVATQATSELGSAYRITVVYDVTCSAPCASGDFSELQVSSTGIGIFSMRTSTFDEIDQAIIPGMSRTSTAVFVDADGSGFSIDITSSSATANFAYNFYIISVERLD